MATSTKIQDTTVARAYTQSKKVMASESSAVTDQERITFDSTLFSSDTTAVSTIAMISEQTISDGLSEKTNLNYFALLVSQFSSFVPQKCPPATNIGPQCNTSNAPCDILQPCQNNGTCSNKINSNGYRCVCQAGFYGDRCEDDRRFCKSDTCANRGECLLTARLIYRSTMRLYR